MRSWTKILAGVLAAAIPLVAAAPAAAQDTAIRKRQTQDTTPDTIPEQGERPVSGDVFTHAGTGMEFAERIGDFVRTGIRTYDREGLDQSVGYALDRGGEQLAIVTIYLYPAPQGVTCERMFDGVQEEIRRAYSGVRTVWERRAPSPGGTTPDAAHQARYRFRVTFGSREQPVNSDAYLYCEPEGNWLVKYRATWAESADVEGEIAALIRALNWRAPFDR